MKNTLAVGLLGLSALASAQTVTPATDAVRFAFGHLGGHKALRVRVEGTETIGRASMTISGELFWWIDYDAKGHMTAKIEYSEWRDGILVQRTVGDGKSLYDYNPRRNDYWVGSYGTHGPTPPPRYLANLMDDFTASLKGSMTYLGRLMREAFLVGGYRPWIPGGQEYLVTKDSGVVPDPIWRDRTFVGTETTEYAIFWQGEPAKRSIIFKTGIGGHRGRTLDHIFFTELTKVGDEPRTVDWQARIFTDVVPAAENFVFIPPVGAKPIVGPRPNIG